MGSAVGCTIMSPVSPGCGCVSTITGWCMLQDDDDVINNKTMVQYPQDSGTLVPSRDLVDGTVLTNDTGTLVANSEAGTMLELQSDLGTMVINSDAEEEPTMKSKLMLWKEVALIEHFHIALNLLLSGMESLSLKDEGATFL